MVSRRARPQFGHFKIDSSTRSAIGVKLIAVVDYGFKLLTLEEAGMKIGDLSQATGVHVETIRYYQRLGLVPTPGRSHGTARRYGDAAVRQLRFIKRSQRLGFSLGEVKFLLALSEGEHCAQTRAFAQSKKRLVRQKIADLRAMESALDKLIRACRSRRSGRGCPIIEGLAGA